MDKKKSLIVFAIFFLLSVGVFFELPQNFIFDINSILNSKTFLNPFLAFIPTNYPLEEESLSEEPESDVFTESVQNLDEETEEKIEMPEDIIDVVGSENTQEILDDIIEKFDIIKQKASVLIEEYNLKNNLEKKEEEPEPELEIEDKEDEEEIIEDENDEPSIVYSKILISEIQIAGLNEEKDEFVELYNPNTTEIDLTGWYLQRKTETGSNYSTFVSSALFSGRKISAKGYFLIAREGSSFVGLADIFTDSSLGNNGSSSSLAFKNPNGEISDKVGFNLANDFESAPTESPEKGQSIGRKWDESNNIEQDVNNNFIDFELNLPTPKSVNVKYIPPVVPPPVFSGGGGGGSNCENSPDLKNILINEIQIEGETVNDDWVELYNPNDEAVCLSNWSIQKASVNGNISRVKNFINGAKILGKNYFLIVRSNAGQELLNLADMTCSSLELSSEFAGGNTIYLVKKKEVIVDENDQDIVD